MGLKDYLSDITSHLKNGVNLEETSKETRLTISIIISLVFFFTFLAISGDITSAGCITAGLEIVMLYAFSIM